MIEREASLDFQEKLFRKQNNIYRLHELVDSVVGGAQQGSAFSLSEELIKRLHSVAMTGLLDRPGEYRTGEVRIQNSPHQCPSWIGVPALMQTLCAYVNENWERSDLIHLAAFVMWRLNWVHPFPNGNGRTARASSYLVLCAKHGQLFPPKHSIIEQIQADKVPYYAALRAVDAHFAATQDIAASLRPLEVLLTELLKRQIKANF